MHILPHLRVVLGDVLNIHQKADENINYLDHMMNWLKQAQDANIDGGISLGYSFIYGWMPSYPETTGYIIPTFLNYFHKVDNEEYLSRAIKMADWLVSIQSPDGSIKAIWGNAKSKPIIFDTGQVLQGFASIYKETLQDKYLKSAIKAANWLIDKQHKDGAWRQCEFNDITHAYNTRVDWPLLMVYQLTLNDAYLKSASRNIDWVLGNQGTNGWFRNNAFDSHSQPFLHTIAYAIEGLLESAVLTGKGEWLDAASRPAEVLLRKFEATGILAGIYNDEWKATTKDRCLTGEAQMAVCWMRLSQLCGDRSLLNAAFKVNNNLKRLQNTISGNKGIRGGVKGSHPIWGSYSPFTYPNWAAKFFADALMLEDILKK